MYDLAIIGLGRVGFRTLDFLLKWKPNLRVIGIDCTDRSKTIAEKGFSIDFVKLCNPSSIVEHLRDVELVATALPSSIIYEYVNELIHNGFSVIDVSYIGFDPYVFNNTCLSKAVTYVPDAGFAPGFSNLVVGYLSKELGELDAVEIYVGGIPVEPKPPLYYEITWSPEDLIEEYVRKARLVINGEVREVDPLEKTVEINIPEHGVYEGFYSDGLHTLLRNIRAKNMFEVTIRHPGHLGKVKVLRELGFFDEKPVEIDGLKISPKWFTAKLLSTMFPQTSSDEAILYIRVRKGESAHSVLSVLKRSIGSATVDFTSAVFAETIIIALEEGLEPGVHPLEDYSLYYDDYVEKLREIGASITAT